MTYDYDVRIAKAATLLRSAALAGALILSRGALAVIVAGGDGTQNTAAPANLSYWNNIGLMPFGTGIYLGGDWVLTAEHVQGGNNDGYAFVLPDLNGGAGATFFPVSASQVQVPQAGGGGADLSLFRLRDDPLLHTLPRVQFGQTPAIGTSVTVVGSGLNRDTTLHTWKLSNPNPVLPVDPSHPENMVWTDVTGKPIAPNSVTFSGYLYGSGRSKRWGTNVTIDQGGGQPTQVGDNTNLFGTRFDSVDADSQLAPYDSGGSVFVNNRLVGLNLLNGTFSNEKNAALGQPADTAVFKDESYYANLADYVDDIARITQLHPSVDGDANLDGLVNASDFKLLYKNLETGTKWSQGDFNLDGQVNFEDFQIFERSFGLANTAAALAAEGVDPGSITGTQAPEPGALAVVCVGMGGWMLSRRRGYCSAVSRA